MAWDNYNLNETGNSEHSFLIDVKLTAQSSTIFIKVRRYNDHAESLCCASKF